MSEPPLASVRLDENTARPAELRRGRTGLDAEDDMTVIVSYDLPDIAASGLPEHVRSPRQERP